MATGWVKSLQCKSRAFDDVFSPAPRNLIASSSCRKSAQSIKDVIDTAAAAKHHHHNHNHKLSKLPKSHHHHPDSFPSPSPAPAPPPSRPGHRHSPSEPAAIFPALTELPEGHPSRNVVEIIFHTSWSDKSFAGRIEMIFKVQNGSRTSTRFEEYRELVKSRAGLSSGTGGGTWEENARCVADGNEMMRFYCLGPAGDARGGGAWVFPGVKGSAICTFSGSGGAHESAGGGKGRRAMLVCRVVAGRVSKRPGEEKRVGFESVSGDDGELLVFDSRAVLPCFLIIYKL
ncbi:unnamed protein product [Linum tenue]|uniref:Uncharacterized protein n=1 Tax=Linum tenue TaxID=586396 RepID=A0AAV0JU56_9ROSI|nr:unnamed protein product [Linum tenue]